MSDPADLPEPLLALIASERVSGRTRLTLLARGAVDAAHLPTVLTEHQFAILGAVVDRVIPQTGPALIDIAARIERSLAAGIGDGWRFAQLPGDLEAYRAALDSLDSLARTERSAAFVDLDAQAQDALLGRIQQQSASWASASLSAVQMALWFEDLRSDAVRIYVAHPLTQARIGYQGFANGGDGERRQGFQRLAAGDREGWER
ncbi:hypothetical protein BH10PSE17_BH10PSE17_03970 [soil metagenome]